MPHTRQSVSTRGRSVDLLRKVGGVRRFLVLGDSIDGAVIKLREKVSQEDSDRASSILCLSFKCF